MSLEELKQKIEQQTGIPAKLLTGETPEENIAQAKALLAYKREAPEDKSPREQFAEWFSAQLGDNETDLAGAALERIQEQLRGYPSLKDGGTPYINGATYPDARSAQEQFAEWAGQKMAYNPQTKDGWTPLF